MVLLKSVTFNTIQLPYRGNFGSGKCWQMIKISPKFSHLTFILKILCDNHAAHARTWSLQCRYLSILNV